MNIDGQAEFERTGNTYLRVRDCLHTMSKQPYIERHWYERVLGKDLENSNTVFDILIEHGYMQANGTVTVDVWNRETWQLDNIIEPSYLLTNKGCALANASAAKPVHRATAEKALAGFLDRVEQAAADPMYLWVVERVVLFGSMLDTTRDRVSDVDLALRIVQNESVYEAAGGHQLAGSVFLSELNGERHPSGYQGEAGVRKFLKSRSRVLSLASLSDDGAIAGLPPETTPHRVIYERGRES
ncbi:hypothetical protein [Nocardia camponoti]|uniref:Nucleotidyltransferase domain-containing protein n=1 Tax=Nocardia camponoti TaxID=1616106 RepID=A0A917QQQ4_9NOCA|nr:hypothetical protein [Nocardia camponoti]GGK63702.1 hypothetical protein GCM10011591_39930 [Nocardia camponoti]